MDKRIRLYEEKDRNEILSFTKGLYASGYIPHLLNYHKNHPERTIPFIFEEDKVIKAICFFHFSTKEDGWLMGMRVKKEFQKEGVAIVFTRGLIDYGIERRLKWLGLNTSFKNKSVHTLCKRLRFERNEAYYIYEFIPIMLRELKQKRTIELNEVNKKEKVEDYFKTRRLKRLLFVIDPGFVWLRITVPVLGNLITGKNLYLYNNNLISLQRWGEYIVANVFGKYTFAEYVDFLSQFYKEYPKGAKGRVILCVKSTDAKGLKKLFNKIATHTAIKRGDIEESDWYVYGKFL